MLSIRKIFLLAGMLSQLCYAQPLSISYIKNKKSDFKHYLSGLSWQMSAPWEAIKLTASALGYSKNEINGIPVAFPFLYEEKYKKALECLLSDSTIELINQLLDEFEQQSIGITSSSKKRELLHTIIHRYSISFFNLPATTTTKQLAAMVEKRSISIDALCILQIAYFFVKYHLDL